jgi:tyrosyl-tRNA synthetase
MDKIDEILTRRVANVLPTKEGLKTLIGKKKLRLYQGFDPTGGRLHLGHSVGIRKLMDFANLGHEVIFLFGTGTVLVGDPSQRDTGRKLITQEEIDDNIKGWKKQVSPLVDWEKVKIMQNGDWLTQLKLKDIINISSNISATQLFKREMFQSRIGRGDTVWYHETLYPLLQGYDSVIMDVDLEVGGTDQEFNMLIGRELMQKMKGKNKFVLTTPMILGTDGKQMSKSSGNCVWLDDNPNDMFAKLMGILDDQIIMYLETVTDIPLDRINEIRTLLKSQKMHPLDAKKELAMAVVTQLHSLKDAESAKNNFENTVQKGNSPQKIKELIVPKDAKLLDAIAQIVGSRSQAKRLVVQRAVDIDGKVAKDSLQILNGDEIIKIGKKEFIKIKIK